MNVYQAVLSFIIAIISGFISGSVGIGSSVVMIPLLLLGRVLPNYDTITGTMLFTFLFPISIGALMEYAKRGQVNYQVGLVLVVIYMLASFLTSKIQFNYDEKTKRQISAGIMIIMAALTYIA